MKWVVNDFEGKPPMLQHQLNVMVGQDIKIFQIMPRAFGYTVVGYIEAPKSLTHTGLR